MPADAESLVNAAKLLNWVFAFGAVLALTITLGRSFGYTRFKVVDLEFQYKNAWLAFTILTALHWFLAWIFVRAAAVVASTTSQDVATKASEGVTKGGLDLLFFRDLGTRDPLSILFGISVPSDWRNDPAFLLQALTTVLVLAAVTRWEKRAWVGTFVVAIALVVANWGIGTWWALRFTSVDAQAAKLQRAATQAVPAKRAP